MRMSKRGLMALIGHEGIVTSPYRDSVGTLTLGVGHTAAAGEPDPASFRGIMTVDEAFELLRRDIVKYEDGVNKAVHVPLKQHEFDALVSFHYNTGAISRATLTKTLNAGDKAKAAKQFMNWSKPAEIIPRRRAEMKMFRDGVYPEPFANIYSAVDGRVQWSKAKRVYLPDLIGSDAAKPNAPTSPKPNGGFLSILIQFLKKLFGG